MKKIKAAIIALCSAAVCVVIMLSGCTSYTTYTLGKQEIVKESGSNIYSATWYSWDGQEQTKTFTVADSYEGHPITHLGSTVSPYFYCFGITFPVEYKSYQYITYDDILKEEYEVTASESVLFTVYIGCNIVSLYSICYEGQEYFTEENTVVYVYPEYYFECSADNKYFYSQDGVLYNKDGTVAMWQYAENALY